MNSTQGAHSAAGENGRRILFMLALVVAGEAVFALPFHVTRFFRPTFLEVFGFSNTQLGAAMAGYGVVAMLSYFPGGPLADRFSARGLLASSLVLTALGGVYMATIPGLVGMSVLWGFFGCTSILLFWAALIRTTRVWGGDGQQGLAFGILDGGRGLFAAVLAVGATQTLQWVMPEEVASASGLVRKAALQKVIWLYVVATLLSAGLVWAFVPAGRPDNPEVGQEHGLQRHITTVLRMPAVWMQALIVIAAYVSFKAVDGFGLFAVDAYGMDEVQASWISGVSAWVRPLAALLAGVLADRWLSSKVIASGFVLLILTFGTMGLLPVVPGMVWILVLQIIISCIAVYGFRGVYFALFEEASVPTVVTGTAVGLVSVIGYTPDIFVGLVQGVLLDGNPGLQGHQLFFLFTAGVAGLGLLATLGFVRFARQSRV